ncbi:hypothetical protein TRAPUB_2732 [Trametes pubescens]|uniref:Uncharacterized protein n=1 Tax=Trametes pubescens TaxID=154538 RepID=A0A1M2VG01_TRAPU|nr:hypothetical protein TRAPUB_2732 [Trametes pubescens]
MVNILTARNVSGTTNHIAFAGTLYFFILFAINISQIVVAAKQPAYVRLTSILISRFLLNLRRVAKSSERATYANTAGAPVISTYLPSVYPSSGTLGNLGATLYSIFEADTDTAGGSYVEKDADDPCPAADVRGADVELVELL